MIISPPFLPAEGPTTPAEKWKTDPMMDKVDEFELFHSGVFPVAFDRRWHPGMHLVPYGGLGQKEPVRAIADGEVVAYRVAKLAITDGQKKSDGTDDLNSNTGFVLLKHTTDTGDGRTITFYSLYMHLLDITKMQELIPQPQLSQASPNSSPDALPAWLLSETASVQLGAGKKVYRKDQLGYRGMSQGAPHLHFEIFMTEKDFSAYFEQGAHPIALGNTQPDTPASTDYWGSTYFVIPAGSTFVSVPPGLANAKTASKSPKPLFPALDAGTLADNSTLYVEAYFSRGERFMRAWLDSGDGKLVLLTPEPVQDKFAEYEYTLYERSTKLYETCPSEGYELLRFGRILSAGPQKLAATECATWVAVPFASGKMGYIDVNQSSVKKLSDADFPFFMNWQKIEDGNTPFDQDGMCGYEELCKVTGVTDARSASQAAMPSEFSQEQRLAAYVQGKADVRAKLRGFICHTKSEWDASNNNERYRGLKEPDGFFGSNEDGYKAFIKFREKFQFVKEAGLGEGAKFWFFHPLAFIRHFRKCGWLHDKEILQLIPQFVIRKPGSHNSAHQGVWESPRLSFAQSLLRIHSLGLNNVLRKFSFNTPLRQACFIANATQETGWFHYLTEGNRGDNATDLHGGWFGRGFLQLTNPNGDMGGGNNNYYRYFKFLGRNPILPPGQRELAWRNEIGQDAFHASHSAGAYWVWPGKSVPTSSNPSRPKVDSAHRYADTFGINERKTIQTQTGMKIWYYNQSFSNCATAVNYPGATGQTPPNMNGLVDRSTSFANALVVLCDVALFSGSNGENLAWPENYSRRNVK